MFRKEIAERYRRIYGRSFLQACSKPLKKSIRTNTLRITHKALLERLERQRFILSKGFVKGRFIIERERRPIGSTIEHLLGYFYVQDVTSMIPPLWLKPTHKDVVLDMCASPGGKTTHLSELMRNKGEIIALDNDKRKNKAMIMNLERMGAQNATFLNLDALKVSSLGMKFDKILLDAPCSCSGITMKDKRIEKKLSLSFVRKYAEKQKKLLKSGSAVLKERGSLVYSTCSVDPLENECVTSFAEAELGLKLKRKKQFLPHEDGTAGFFVAEMVK